MGNTDFSDKMIQQKFLNELDEQLKHIYTEKKVHQGQI